MNKVQPGTHCRHGHLWSETLRLNRNGRRICRACRKQDDLKRRLAGPKGPPRKQFCPKGHPMVDGNLAWGNAWVCLTCKRACDRRNQKPVTHEKLTRVIEALHEGKTLAECYGKKNNRYVGGKIVDSGALIKFLREHPRIGTRIRRLSLINRKAIMQEVADRKRLVAAPALIHNNGADAYEAINRATANLWEGERGDVMSLMFVAIAEGRLLPKDAAARLPEFVKLHRYRPRVYGDRSLDAPLYDDSSLTLRDNITRGMWQ